MRFFLFIACVSVLARVVVACSSEDDPPTFFADGHVKQRVLVYQHLMHDRWHRAWPHVLSVWRFDDQGRRIYAGLSFNQDATDIRIVFPKGGAGEYSWSADTGETTTQYDDGTWVFAAKDAMIEGGTAKLEQHPGNIRVGFWTNANDALQWTMHATRWGMYEVELVYSLAGEKSNEVAIAVGEHEVNATIAPTGSWYTYQSINCGRIYLEKPGDHDVRVSCVKLNGGAVMNLKAVLLRPSHEGDHAIIDPRPRKLKESGKAITLHSRDATVLGKTLRYEPDPRKLTLGYWSDPHDAARWRFRPGEVGEYDVEVLQGCGEGQGGSEVALEFSHGGTITFTVEDTGGWQNFKPRIVGRVVIPDDVVKNHDVVTLDVRPVKKAGAAVMDLRQVRLVKVEE